MHEEAQERRRVAGNFLRAEKIAADGRPVEAVAGDAQQERLQDLCAGDGRTEGWHGQRGRQLPGGMQKIAAGDGRRYAGRDQAGFLEHLLDRATSGVLAARAGVVRAARAAGGARRRPAILPANCVGRGDRADCGAIEADAARRDVLVFQRTVEQ